MVKFTQHQNARSRFSIWTDACDDAEIGPRVTGVSGVITVGPEETERVRHLCCHIDSEAIPDGVAWLVWMRPSGFFRLTFIIHQLSANIGDITLYV